MSDHKIRTNPALLLITLLFCLLIGGILYSSSAQPSNSGGSQPNVFVAKDSDNSDSLSADIKSDLEDSQDADDAEEPEAVVTETPVPTEEPVKKAEKDPVFEISPEASSGVWTPSGSNWMFLVDGVPYTGWLTDVDLHRYYFNADGIMQTGWLDDNGKRYYLNLDGIMQTGEVTISKETYYFLEDGSLDGYSSDEDAEGNEDTAETEDAAEVEEAAVSEEKEKESDAPSERKTIALTFDDGPSSFTDRLLDCLEANNAKATFFLVGEEVDYFRDEVKRMDELGFELGNHTYSHTELTTLDAEGISSTINSTDALITEITGHASTVLRPPYGSVNDLVTSSVTTPMFLWSIDTLDWETLDAQSTVDTVLAEVQDGSIILMHDIFSESVDAAEILIPKLIEQGYELVTLHELAQAHGVELENGSVYSEFTSTEQTDSTQAK